MQFSFLVVDTQHSTQVSVQMLSRLLDSTQKISDSGPTQRFLESLGSDSESTRYDLESTHDFSEMETFQHFYENFRQTLVLF
jgi:hypothetical protein